MKHSNEKKCKKCGRDIGHTGCSHDNGGAGSNGRSEFVETSPTWEKEYDLVVNGLGFHKETVKDFINKVYQSARQEGANTGMLVGAGICDQKIVEERMRIMELLHKWVMDSIDPVEIGLLEKVQREILKL